MRTAMVSYVLIWVAGETGGTVSAPDHAIEIALISSGLAAVVAIFGPILRDWRAERAARRLPRQPDLTAELLKRIDERDEQIQDLLEQSRDR